MSKAYLTEIADNLRSVGSQDIIRDKPAPFSGQWPTRIEVKGVLLSGKKAADLHTLYIGKPSVSAFNFIHKKVRAGAVIQTVLEFDRKFCLWSYYKFYPINIGAVARFYFPRFAVGDKYFNAREALTDELLCTSGNVRRWTKRIRGKFVYYSFIPIVSKIAVLEFAKLLKRNACKI